MYALTGHLIRQKTKLKHGNVMMWRNMDELCCKNRIESMYMPYNRHKIMVDQFKNELENILL